MSAISPISKLVPGMQLLVGGDQVVTVTKELADAFAPGDAVYVVEKTSQVLHLPKAERAKARQAVDGAVSAFQQMGSVSEEQISEFYRKFASLLEDDRIWERIQRTNDEDVADAKARGRSTTRLVAGPKLRASVIEGLRGWSGAQSQRGKVLEVVKRDGFRAELIGAELGVVGFIFEGRPNVVADATGVLRGGNTVVFRIGRDALRTAKAIMALALRPALVAAGLPEGAVSLVDSSAHAAGWAMFGDGRLSLAVARGSGPAVDTLGGIAQKAGIPVSLHGTGGAWIVVDAAADPAQVEQVVADSLDRKVCNTLNTLCVPRAAAERIMPAVLAGLETAAKRLNQNFKLHVAEGDAAAVPSELFERVVSIDRAAGPTQEKQAQSIATEQLGLEWEWEQSPEMTLKLVDSIDEAVDLFNRYSPQFVGTLLSPNPAAHERFYQRINAPFVGDGFSRWVDGQFALNRPELGLSNWSNGRLFGRGGVLSGDSVFTVRTRYVTESATG